MGDVLHAGEIVEQGGADAVVVAAAGLDGEVFVGREPPRWRVVGYGVDGGEVVPGDVQVGRVRVQAVAAHGEVQAVRVNAGDGLVALAEGVTQFAPEGAGDKNGRDGEAQAEECVVFGKGVSEGNAKHRQQEQSGAGAAVGTGGEVCRFVPIAHAVAGAGRRSSCITACWR